jgi:hypothetical protein
VDEELQDDVALPCEITLEGADVLEALVPDVLRHERLRHALVREDLGVHADDQHLLEPIEGTSLMFASNTTANVFIESKEQRAFVLTSGRWFSGPPSMAGPWTFVAGESLPADFRRIPDTSPKENVKASIPGTPQAAEATVANEIPQTAKVKRSAAKFTPAMDGTRASNRSPAPS